MDVQSDWIRKVFDPCNQMRLGVIMTDLGMILAIAWPIIARSEPPIVYEMSAIALVFGGIGVVVTAKLAEDTTE